MKKLIGSVLTACAIVSATTAFAAVKEGSFSVTPLIGGYLYENDQSKDPTLVLGARAGYNFTKAIGVEAVYDFVTSTKLTYGDSRVQHRYGGQALYHFFPDNVFVPYLAAGLSNVNFKDTSRNINNRGVFDYGVGAKYFLADDVAIRGDVRHLVYNYEGGTYNNMEFTLGAYIQFGDVKPAVKAVAATPPPEPVKEVVAPAPAPAPVIVPAPVAVVVIPPADSDHDGVADTLDKCPDTPAGVAVDSNGCPLDSDKDGVPDYMDKCPNTPAGVTVDSNGCPLDSDKDGVPDYMDKCPSTPAGVKVDAKGCPVETAKRFCDKPAVIAIAFDSNKSEVKAKYHVELDKLGNFMKEFPSSKGTIEGHTDAAGNKAANQKLSQERADSVRHYIITKFGIDGNRITAKGHGSTKPVASNKTAAGKSKNRRIEAVFTCE